MSCERVARARHIRPQSGPNPRLRAPPVFWRAPGAPGASGGRWGALAGAPWGGLSLGWGGRNFRVFNFRVRWPRNSIRGQTIMAKQTAPREAAVSPSSGRFQVVCGGGPDALVRCPTQCTLADAWPSEPTPRGAAPRRRSPPRSHRRIRLLIAARLTAAVWPTRRNCAAASASLENERAARATVRSRAQRRRAKPAGRSSA